MKHFTVWTPDRSSSALVQADSIGDAALKACRHQIDEMTLRHKGTGYAPVQLLVNVLVEEVEVW